MATFTLVSSQLLGFPKAQTTTKITDTSIPVAGLAVTPANFGLSSIDSLICTDAEITGSVNTQTLRPKYDPASGKIFYFGQDSDAVTLVAKPLGIIPGNIASAVTYNVTAVGSR